MSDFASWPEDGVGTGAHAIDYDRSGLILPADLRNKRTSRLRKAVLLTVVIALGIFSVAILKSSGLLDFDRCSVRAGDGTCVDQIAEHIPR